MSGPSAAVAPPGPLRSSRRAIPVQAQPLALAHSEEFKRTRHRGRFADSGVAAEALRQLQVRTLTAVLARLDYTTPPRRRSWPT